MSDTIRAQATFAQIPTWLLDRCFDANAIQLYAVLSRHANRERRAWPGLERLAMATGSSTRTVQRSLMVLRRAGAIKCQPRRNGHGSIIGAEYLLMNLPMINNATSVASSPQPAVGSSDLNTRQGDTRGANYTTPVARAYKEELDPLELDPKNLRLTEPTGDARNPIAVIFDEHEERFRMKTKTVAHPNGEKPTHTGKDRGIVKHLLKTHSVDQLVEWLRLFFDSDDPFIERSGYTLGVFASQIDRLTVARTKRTKAERVGVCTVHDPPCRTQKECTLKFINDARRERGVEPLPPEGANV